MEQQQSTYHRSIDVNCTHSLLSCTGEKLRLKYAEQLSNEDGD